MSYTQQQREENENFAQYLDVLMGLAPDEEGREKFMQTVLKFVQAHRTLPIVHPRYERGFPTLSTPSLFPIFDKPPPIRNTAGMSMLLTILDPDREREITTMEMLLWIQYHAMPKFRRSVLESDYDKILLSCTVQFVFLQMKRNEGKRMEVALCCNILVEILFLWVFDDEQIMDWNFYKRSMLETVSIVRLKMMVRQESLHTFLEKGRFEVEEVRYKKHARLPLGEFITTVCKKPLKGPRRQDEWFVWNQDNVMMAYDEKCHCFCRGEDGKWRYFEETPKLEDQEGGRYIFSFGEFKSSIPEGDQDVWAFVCEFNIEKAGELWAESQRIEEEEDMFYLGLKKRPEV